MQLCTSIAKRVSKSNLDGMDEERDNRHGMPGQWTMKKKKEIREDERERKMGNYVKKV